MLRCLPDDIVVSQAPGRAAPPQPIGCPDGWQPVAPGVNPVLRCLPGNLAPRGGKGGLAPAPRRQGG
ncbi:hypothetical protein [Luteimonas suaedae]|uniref:hypothetical protein n=1 Tax=Luteimonas suaedae TaxID=2605430 RepID=UPI0011EC3260|nr:hypothetical protein [Luteimonas suaedae]